MTSLRSLLVLLFVACQPQSVAVAPPPAPRPAPPEPVFNESEPAPPPARTGLAVDVRPAVAVDQCPNRCETRNGIADHDGCPDSVPADLQAVLGVLPIQFEPNKAILTAPSVDALKALVPILDRHHDLSFEISGHIDTHNAPKYSIDLSEKRARAVEEAFTRFGLPRRMFRALGYGETQPIDTNRTAAGRAKNRRVELRLRVEGAIDEPQCNP